MATFNCLRYVHIFCRCLGVLGQAHGRVTHGETRERVVEDQGLGVVVPMSLVGLFSASSAPKPSRAPWKAD